MSVSSACDNSYVNTNSWLQTKEGHGLLSSSCSQYQQRYSATLDHSEKSKAVSVKPKTTSYSVKKVMTVSNGNRRPSKQQAQQLDGGFARSTASSRSRAGMKNEDDLGMSQNVIYEALAQAEKQMDNIASSPTSGSNTKYSTLANTTQQQQLRRPSIQSNLRRKSMAETSTRRRPSRVNGDSTTVAATIRATTGSSVNNGSVVSMMAPPQRTRAHSLAIVSNTSRRSSVTCKKTSLLHSPESHVKHSPGMNPTITSARTPVARQRKQPGAIPSEFDEQKPSPIVNPASSSSIQRGAKIETSADPPTNINANCQPPTQPDPLLMPLDRQEPGLVRLVDALRDSLAVERQKAKRELAMHINAKPEDNHLHNNKLEAVGAHRQWNKTSEGVNNEKEFFAQDSHGENEGDSENTDDDGADKSPLHPKKTTTLSRQKQQLGSPALSSADIIYHAKRRLGNAIDSSSQQSESIETKDTTYNTPSSPLRQRTSMVTSIGQSDTRLATQTQLERRASLMAYVRQKTNTITSNHSSDHCERQNQTNNSPGSAPDTPIASTSLVRRQKHQATSLSSRRTSTTPTASLKSLNIAPSSPRQSPLPQKKKNTLPVSTATTSTSSSAHNPSSTTTVRLRKKSMVGTNVDSPGTPVTPNLAATLARRRRSRTESLKEGVPISPSLHSSNTQRSRKKSIASSTQDSTSSSASGQQEFVNPVTKKVTVPPTYTRKRGKTLPGNLAKPPVIQSVTLPPMKMEPIQLPLPKKKNHQNESGGPASLKTTEHRENINQSGSSGECESGEETSIKKKVGKKGYHRRSSTATTPNKKKSSPTDNNSLISTSRRPSMPQLTTSKPTSRKLSISVASKGGWYSYADPGTSTTSKLRSKTSACSVPNSPGLSAAVTRSRKQAINPSPHHHHLTAVSSRKNSLGNTTATSINAPQQHVDRESNNLTVDKGSERTRAMSLHEKLQAMVAQHTMQNNNIENNTVGQRTDDPAMTFQRDRRARKSQNYEIDDKYYDHRLRTNRLSEPFLFASSSPHQQHQPLFAGSKSPHAALQLYGPCLSSFERQEIQEFEDVYFVGPYAKKIQAFAPGLSQQTSNNHGYDDERGDYMIIRQDHLAYRYEILEELGRGSFGQVVKCFDHKTNTSVAIKLIRNKRRFHEQALMEVKILKDLVTWDPEDGHHNVRMTDYFYFRNHLCIVCECLSINLYEFIKKYEYKGFAVSLIKRFAVQLLRSLCLLYDHNVIHCDLKPENILLKHPAKSTIKVIDFGSSCFTNEKMYTYIQSRFYRAPEIILGMTYDTAIDMWSFGCILAELYTGIPIFPGETEQEQLACIMEILNVPDNYIIDRCSRRKLFFDSNNRPRPVINSRGKQRYPGSKSLSTVVRCQDPLFLDFVEQCLKWDPDQRLNPYDALQHGWFTASSKPAPSENTPTMTVAATSI